MNWFRYALKMDLPYYFLCLPHRNLFFNVLRCVILQTFRWTFWVEINSYLNCRYSCEGTHNILYLRSGHVCLYVCLSVCLIGHPLRSPPQKAPEKKPPSHKPPVKKPPRTNAPLTNCHPNGFTPEPILPPKTFCPPKPIWPAKNEF